MILMTFLSEKLLGTVSGSGSHRHGPGRGNVPLGRFVSLSQASISIDEGCHRHPSEVFQDNHAASLHTNAEHPGRLRTLLDSTLGPLKHQRLSLTQMASIPGNVNHAKLWQMPGRSRLKQG